MSTDPETKNAGLLGPLANAYEPTSADADRVLAKITAALAAPVSVAPPPPPARTLAPGRFAVIAGVAALALVAIYAFRQPTQVPSPSATSITTITERPTAPPAVETPEAMPSIAVDALPTAAPTVTAQANKPAPSTIAPADDALAREARLLGEARRAVANGDAAGGLALLDEHARTFPNGFLASDRAAERIVVLCSLGRRDEAVREARAFLANRPASPLTRRVSNSCAGEP